MANYFSDAKNVCVRLARVALGLAVIAVVAAPAAQAQGDNKRKQLVVYVSVSDKQHNALSGLEKKDFSVTVEKVGLPLEKCEEVHAPELGVNVGELPRPSLKGSGNQAASFQNASGEAHGHTLIFLLDKLNEFAVDETRARQQLIKSLKQLEKGDANLVLLSAERTGLSVLADITDDPQVLVDYLTAHTGTPARGPVDPSIKGMPNFNAPIPTMQTPASSAASGKLVDAYKMETPDPSIVRALLIDPNQASPATMSASAYLTLDVFSQVAQAFAHSPGKYDLVWFTERIPFDFHTKAKDNRQGFPPEVISTMNLLASSGMRLHAIHTGSSGGGGGQSFGSPAGYSSGDEYRGPVARSGSVSVPSVGGSSGGWLVEEFTVASGGRFYSSTGDLNKALKEITEQSPATYKLTFAEGPEVKPMTWAPIKVAVNKNSVHVSSATGLYFLSTAEPEVMRRYDVAMALRTSLQFTPVAIEGSLSTARKTDAVRETTFNLHIPAGQATIQEADGNHMDFDVLYVVLNQNNQLVTGKDLPYNLKLSPAKRDEVAQKGLEISNSFEIAPGEYTVRFVVRDNLSGKTGSVFVPLKVE